MADSMILSMKYEVVPNPSIFGTMEVITEPSNTNYEYKLKAKKPKSTWTVFWTVFWVFLTCVALVVLNLTHDTDKIVSLFVGFLPGPQRRMAKLVTWIPGVQKLAMGIIVKGAPVVLELRQAFYETCIFLMLVKMIAGVVFGGMIDLFRRKFKASDFWRLVMIAIRIYILMFLLDGCNTDEMAKKLEKKHIIGVIVGQYCLSSAWDLVKDMGTLTVTDIFSKVMGLWVINATISEKKPSIVVMIGKAVARGSNDLLNGLKDSDQRKRVLDVNIKKPVEDIFEIVATPIFCIIVMMFLLTIIKRIEQFVNKELGISKKVVAAWSVILCLLLGAFFIFHGYRHLSEVVRTLKTAAGIRDASLGGSMTDEPGGNGNRAFTGEGSTYSSMASPPQFSGATGGDESPKKKSGIKKFFGGARKKAKNLFTGKTKSGSKPSAIEEEMPPSPGLGPSTSGMSQQHRVNPERSPQNQPQNRLFMANNQDVDELGLDAIETLSTESYDPSAPSGGTEGHKKKFKAKAALKNMKNGIKSGAKQGWKVLKSPFGKNKKNKSPDVLEQYLD